MENTKPFKRKERVSELIRNELSTLIMRELELDAIMTIMRVEVTEKLTSAHVYVGILPSEKTKKVLDVLSKSAKFLERQLLRKINIKPMPELIFHIDKGSLNAAEVERALLEK